VSSSVTTDQSPWFDGLNQQIFADSRLLGLIGGDFNVLGV